MRKKKSKIIMFLMLSLLISGFSLILNFDNAQVNSGANEQWKNENDDKYLHPRLSDPPEGRYVHRDDPSEATSSNPEGIYTTPEFPPTSVEDALKDFDDKNLYCSYEEPLVGPAWLKVSGYSNFGGIDRGSIYQVIIDLLAYFQPPMLGYSEAANLTFIIQCDNGLSESIVLNESLISDPTTAPPTVTFIGYTVNETTAYPSPFVIDETSFNQIFQRVRDGGYIESISIWANIITNSPVYMDRFLIGVYYIDIYYMWAVPPSPPTNLQVHQRIQHNYLTWDVPSDDGGANITQYNIYRGTVEGGPKSYIGSSPTNYYNDTTASTNVRYYYIVRAENFQGESGDSNEDNGMPRDVPFLVWKYPDEGERVILSVGDAIFNFRYDWGIVDDVELVINGISYGSVWNMTSTILTPYNSSIDGPVTAVLNGYIEGELFINDSRNFVFAKLTFEVVEKLDEGTEFLGTQLYLILHDPNGDNSFSGFAEQTGFSLGVGASVSAYAGFRVKVDHTFMGLGNKYSAKIQYEHSKSHDFRFEVTETTELTSSLDKYNKDYIGPGYGDTYWGEAWSINWKFKSSYRQYFNGTEGYEDPILYYGIIRSEEVILSDYNAPAEWRALNPVYNGWQNVEWDPVPIDYDGGRKYSFSKEVISSASRHRETTINLDGSIRHSFPTVSLTFTFGLERQWYRESEVSNAYTTTYTIYDDESTDHLYMEHGIDQNFGTPIFKTNSSFCKTSKPLEYNTFDYIPPVIAFPDIEFDSTLDGLAPCKDDSPIVMVDISDEGGIQSAIINYSIDDGLNWEYITLSEQIANPGTWDGMIPTQDHGTTVLWYIQAWDLEGSRSTRKDPHDNPYYYTVINRAPSIHITTPNGNEVFENTVRIEWSASDPDDDALTFTIAYNLANTGWHLIEREVTGNNYDWDISGMEFCDTVLVKVTVDDGFGGEAMDESDYVFTVGESAPSTSKPSEINWVPILVIAFISLAGAAFAIAIFIRRSRTVQE